MSDHERHTIRSLIPQQPQRQDAFADQMRDLQVAAVRLGMYDAADWPWKVSVDRDRVTVVSDQIGPRPDAMVGDKWVGNGLSCYDHDDGPCECLVLSRSQHGR